MTDQKRNIRSADNQELLEGSMNFAEWKNSVVPAIVRAGKYGVLKKAVPTKLVEIPSTPSSNSFKSPFKGTIQQDTSSTRTQPDVSARTTTSTTSSTTAPVDEFDREDVWGYLLSPLHQKVLSLLSTRVRDAELCGMNVFLCIEMCLFSHLHAGILH
ncbi:hypothetical protein QFC24_005369 [Naganishia onofrii]|uniref:Uncharacterized protein n=1 Tax=Naganishia onofrii TaxID=1851511 RepID=A0ACC2X932_9TREE|nr:hypothetical protein QFC24_005369 [Naganishia onofrii]